MQSMYLAERRFTVRQRTDTRALVRRVPCCESQPSDAAVWLQTLIDAGADIESADNKGRTPLYIAAGNGQQTAAKVNP